jgi:hypothetical protein
MLTWEDLTKSMVSGWKLYTSADKIFSFKYPSVWNVQPSGEDTSSGVQIIIADSNNEPSPRTLESPGVRILVDKNKDVQKSVQEVADSMKESANDSGGVLLTSAVKLNGVEATRYEIVPATTLQIGSVVIVVQKKDYCVIISTGKYGSVEQDYPIELLLSTVNIY